MAVPDLYVGREPTWFEVDGQPVFIGPNVVVRAGHPIMNGRESLFVPLTVHFDVTDPPAQAARLPEPGEKRPTAEPSGPRAR